MYFPTKWQIYKPDIYSIARSIIKYCIFTSSTGIQKDSTVLMQNMELIN